jgi:hypothetical protein
LVGSSKKLSGQGLILQALRLCPSHKVHKMRGICGALYQG